MIEIALAGLIAIGLGTLAVSLTPAARQDSLLVRRFWPAWLTLAALVYFYCNPEANRRQVLTLGAAALFGVHATFRLWRLRGEKTPRSSRWLKSWLVDTLLIFFSSAPLLLAETELSTDTQTWLDLAAVALFALGFVRSLTARDSIGKIRLGEGLCIWSFYLVALSSSSGFLALFAPLLYTHALRHLLCPKEHTAAPAFAGVEAKAPHLG